MYLFRITWRCQAPPSFRVKDFLLNKEINDILHITEAFFFFSSANFLPQGGGEDWH